MWKIYVRNQSIEVREKEILADHQIHYVQFRFTFEGDWKKFHKVVQFTQGNEVYSIVLGTEETSCYLPSELHAGAAKMSIFGYDTEADTTVRATTVPITLNIRESGFEGEDTHVPPTPDLYIQLLKKIEAAGNGGNGKSAYDIALEHGFVGTEEEWLASLYGKNGTNGKNGKDGHDGINGKSAFDIAIDYGFVGTEAEWLESLHGKNGADGKAGKDGVDGKDGRDGTSADLSEYAKLSDVSEMFASVAENVHTHINKDIIDAITASYTIEERQEIQNTLASLQVQIDNLHLFDSSITLFRNGAEALTKYGESVYTFYNDGYRSIAGFSDTYKHFCSDENDYALYYNQPDFNWGANIYTMCTESIHINPSKKIMMSYNSGFTELGEMWLVPKSNQEMSSSDTASYIYESIINNNAFYMPFNWLDSVGMYITVMHDCSQVPVGDYYIAWKAVTDNTHPMIRSVKVLEVAD